MDDAPAELLIRIFEIVYRAGFVNTPLALSHVCRRWYRILLDLSYQWTHLHLCHTRQPDVLRDMLHRSSPHPLFLSLDLTTSNFESLSPSDVSVFIDVLTEVETTSRIQDLSITGPNYTLSHLTPRFSDFPSLVNLSIKQVPLTNVGSSTTYVGPFDFNPNVFRSLKLEGVGIRVTHPSVLAGIYSLTLIRATENTLNQAFFQDHDHSTPCMTHLTQLRLIGTPKLPNQGEPHYLYPPAFDRSTLKSLFLSSYTSELPHAVRLTLNPVVLEELELEDVRGLALGRLLGLINSIAEIPLPFVQLHSLTLRNIPGFSHTLAILLLRAFPQLRILRLQNVDVDQFITALRSPALCPFLYSLFVDGTQVPRPDAIMMIAAPS